MHHLVSARLPILCLSPVGYCLPDPNLHRFREPLYTYVRHFGYGRFRDQPQECRQVQELAPESILHQQGMT